MKIIGIRGRRVAHSIGVGVTRIRGESEPVIPTDGTFDTTALTWDSSATFDRTAVGGTPT